MAPYLVVSRYFKLFLLFSPLALYTLALWCEYCMFSSYEVRLSWNWQVFLHYI